MRHPSVQTAVYREDPSGAEHEVAIEVEYSFCGADPDVGIMSGHVEVQAVYLLDENEARGPMLEWSETDSADFDNDISPDLIGDSGG